jgi:hydrogenase maturation protease
MTRALAIGYGNLLRGDDGAGPRAAERLRALFPEATVLIEHQLTPELAEPVSRAALVFFIDAAAAGEPGEIRRVEVLPEAPPTAFSHQVSPQALLYMAQTLYGNAPDGVLYTIAGGDFGIGEGLTPRVEEAVAEVVREIAGLLGYALT